MAPTNLTKESVITRLYCMNKQDIPDVCATKECLEGRCLCLDEEQLALLDSLLGACFIINMEDGRLKIKDETPDQGVAFCETAKNGGCTISLLSCKAVENNALQEALKLYIRNDKIEALKRMIRSIPVVQYVNMNEELVSRDSVCYLCLYGEEAAEFLHQLLKAILVEAINLYLDHKSLSGIMSFIEGVFERIDGLYDGAKYQKFCEQLLEIIAQYDRKLKDEKLSVQIFREVLSTLYQETEQKNNFETKEKTLEFITSGEHNQMFELIWLYDLVKKTFEIMGEQAGEKSDTFFDVHLQGESKHSVYDKMISGVACLESKNADEKENCLRMLKRLLQTDPECADEEAEEFKQMCTQNI